MNITGLVLSSTQIRVSWGEVPSEDRNGVITHYEVHYTPLDMFEGGIANGSIITGNISVMLEELEENVTYSVRVRAHNSAGTGPFSDALILVTFEDGKYLRPLCLIFIVL